MAEGGDNMTTVLTHRCMMKDDILRVDLGTNMVTAL